MPILFVSSKLNQFPKTLACNAMITSKSLPLLSGSSIGGSNWLWCRTTDRTERIRIILCSTLILVLFSLPQQLLPFVLVYLASKSSCFRRHGDSYHPSTSLFSLVLLSSSRKTLYTGIAMMVALMIWLSAVSRPPTL
jgi:hypothetical protein